MVYYVCFYADREIEKQVITWPSAWSKIEYIVDTIKKTGESVTIVSVSQSAKGYFRKRRIQIDEKESHIYFSSYKSGVRILTKLGILVQNLKTLCFLLRNVKSDDSVIVYHSLFHRFWINLYGKVLRKPFVIQIEELYSMVNDFDRKHECSEKKMLSLAQSWICVNDLIIKNKPEKIRAAVSYGNYALPIKYDTERNGKKIKCAYAGVIESRRNAAFLAVDAMRFLPDCYELHIMGFGDAEDIAELNRRIESITVETGKEKVFFHGMLSGAEYHRRLQACDVGLSTHVYDETNFASADNSFPSKVLVYLANGLRVVAQRLDCLEKSKIGELITFYNEPNAEELAKAIMLIDMTEPYDGRKIIQELDNQFIQDLHGILPQQ